MENPKDHHEVPIKNDELKRDGPNNTTQAELNAPNLDEKTGKPTIKAIDNAKQAHSIATNLKKVAMEADGRLGLAGTIAGLYSGKNPFDPKELEREGRDWYPNFSTGFLGSIVDRVTPQMRDPIFRADLITHSTLPPDAPRSSEKSRKFCEDTTKLIRGWRGWNDFMSLSTQDIVLHGNATVGHLGRDWRPRLFRPDQCFLFDGAEQHASKQQVVVFWQAMLIHDFLELFDDHDAAEMAGYNVEECIKAANHSSGKQTTDSKRTPLEFEDAIREKGRIGYGAENQARTVNLFHIVVREYDQKIALWTVSEEGEYAVRHIEDLGDEIGVESMEDVLTQFTLQVGNGKFYGSKGLGRLLANIHIAIERLVCQGTAQSWLSGLLVLTSDALGIKNLKPVIQDPFLIIKGTPDMIAKEQITFNAQDWKMVYDLLLMIAETVAGAFLPPNLNTAGAANTKIEAAQKAEREIALRQGVLGRFFAQFADLIGTIQRRIYSDDNMKEAWRIYKERQKMQGKGLMPMARRLWKRLKSILGKEFNQIEKPAAPDTKIADAEAVDTIVGLLEAEISVQEILQLAQAQAGNDVQSNNAERDQATIGFLMDPLTQQNPYYNKQASAKMVATIAIGQDRAKQIEQPQKPDPSDLVNESNKQTVEFTEMMGGENMGVSETDNHFVHRQTLAPKLGMAMGILQKAVQGNMPLQPEILNSAGLLLQHYQQHLQLDHDSPQERVQAEAQTLQQYGQVFQAAQKMVEQQQQDAQRQAQAGAGGPNGNGQAPMGANGQNGQIPSPDQAQPHEIASSHIDNATKIAQTAHMQEIDQQRINLDRGKLALEADKHAHKIAMDTVSASLKTADTLTNAAIQAKQAGEADAEKDFKAQPLIGTNPKP